jgi:hypothetical protein
VAINRFSRSTRYDIRIGESNFNGINRLEPTTRTNISSQKQSQWREVISGIVNVGSNLICTGDGLIVNESNTVVNTNGHSIVGPGTGSSKVGFMIPNTYDVTIQGPGTVSHFQAGLLITRSNNVKVKSLILEDNEIGIF